VPCHHSAAILKKAGVPCHHSVVISKTADAARSNSAVTSKMPTPPSVTRPLPLKRRRCHQSLGGYLYNADVTSNHSVVDFFLKKNTEVALLSLEHYFRSADVVNNNSAVTPKSDKMIPNDSATTSEAPTSMESSTDREAK
jgi:hypothetical protein